MKREVFEHIQQKAVPVLQKHNVEFAGIFGSFARGQERATSDIDFIIRYAKPKGLFDMVDLAQELSRAVNRKVDIVTEKAVHPYMRKNIADHLYILYGQRRYL